MRRYSFDEILRHRCGCLIRLEYGQEFGAWRDDTLLNALLHHGIFERDWQATCVLGIPEPLIEVRLGPGVLAAIQTRAALQE